MKEKRRSNEKRKEKSRDAARCRRSRETDIFTELAGALPVPPCEASHLDKASIMRLAIAHLKTRSLMDAVPKPLAKPETTSEMDEFFLKALDGFVLVLDNNGDMVYTSHNVKDYLGIAQMDLMGQSVFDYSHPCDHDEIRESFSLKASEINEDHTCNFFLRLKCTLTSKGRKVNLKSASYKVIHCTGRLIANSNNNNANNKEDGDSNDDKVINEKEPNVFLVVVAAPVPHPSNIEIPLGKYTFLSKHNLNMKFTYADDKLAEFLGWDSNELIGQSVFDFHHAQDNISLDKSFKSLFHKGQCETIAYRFLSKRGGYAWVVTQATLIHCSRLQKPLSVVCVNYLLSGIENEDEIYSIRQLEAKESTKLKKEQQQQQQQLPAVVPIHSVRKPLTENPISVTASLFRFQDRSSCRPQLAVPAVPRIPIQSKENIDIVDKAKSNPPPVKIDQSIFQKPPLTATASIFAPRTKDMNKGFLTFSEDQPGLTMLKDEPEDLTHLAPTPGDVCVPLDEPPFLSDMLDEFMLSGNYCPLLPDGPADPLTEAVCRAQIEATNKSRINNVSTNNSQLSNDNLKDMDPSILGDNLQSKDDCSSSDGCGSGGDPFIYRDTPSRCSLGTDLHSPTMTKSPEGSGIGDSLSTNDSGGGGGLSEDEMLMMSINDVIADDEMSLRAPYIPMSDQDEALQLLISDDMVMWGPSQNNEKKPKWLTEEEESPSLAQLLKNETNSKKLKDQGNTLVNPSHVLGQINVKSLARDNTAERERTNKRTHAYTTKSNNHQNHNQNHYHESKRLKQHNDSPPPILTGPSNSNINLNNLLLNGNVQKSQLLQQLVSQQLPKSSSRNGWSDLMKNNNSNNNNLFDDRPRTSNVEPGGKTNILNHNQSRQHQQHQQQQQQSNSVLMNLLVSGCDIQELQNQLQEPTLPNLSAPCMLIPQGKSPSSIQMNINDQLQTVPQWPRMESNNFSKKQHPITYSTMNYDTELFINGPESDELLRALDPNLV